MKKSFKKKLRTALLVLVVVIVIAALAVAAIFILKDNSAKQAENERTAHMENLGREFYTELFYKQLAESRSKDKLVEFLKKYEETGVNTTLDNLSRTANKENQKKVKTLLSDKHKCNSEKTKVFIYPKAPYGKNDFTLKVELSCGDKKKDDTKDKNKDKDEPILDEKKNDKKK